MANKATRLATAVFRAGSVWLPAGLGGRSTLIDIALQGCVRGRCVHRVSYPFRLRANVDLAAIRR
jgi:hypothetical protein